VRPRRRSGACGAGTGGTDWAGVEFGMVDTGGVSRT
jgi:hypothetical protein